MRGRSPEPVAQPVAAASSMEPVTVEPALFAAGTAVPEMVEKSGVEFMANAVTSAHEPNLHIPTFLRKQLD